MRTIKYIVVHCTGGNPTQSLKSIQEYWKKIMKWNSPGYHYLIAPDGTEHFLQEESKPANGVAGHNAHSLHVCYIGGKDARGNFSDTRTEDQKATLFARLEDLKERYPQAVIVGHRDLSPDTDKNGKVDHYEYIKVCPCFDAKTEYQSL